MADAELIARGVTSAVPFTRDVAEPRYSWWCDPCAKQTVTVLTDDVPVCAECGTPIERHLEPLEPLA